MKRGRTPDPIDLGAKMIRDPMTFGLDLIIAITLFIFLAHSASCQVRSDDFGALRGVFIFLAHAAFRIHLLTKKGPAVLLIVANELD